MTKIMYKGKEFAGGGLIDTNDIKDGAVTSTKIDWTTLVLEDWENVSSSFTAVESELKNLSIQAYKLGNLLYITGGGQAAYAYTGGATNHSLCKFPSSLIPTSSPGGNLLSNIESTGYVPQNIGSHIFVRPLSSEIRGRFGGNVAANYYVNFSGFVII